MGTHTNLSFRVKLFPYVQFMLRELFIKSKKNRYPIKFLHRITVCDQHKNKNLLYKAFIN
ncbi:hypothetical protein AMR47_19555 [Leptospira interrogans]|nr:hypothetical protein AMR47_19555 [Leptospira interrogans]